MSKVNYTLRARIINALENLPDGFSFVTTVPFHPIEEWIKAQPAAKQEACILFIESMAKNKPHLIGGSGWREEADRRLKALDVASSQTTGGRGMSAGEISQKVASDKQTKAQKAQATAKEQKKSEAENAETGSNAVADAFVGSGAVRVDEEEDWGAAPSDLSD